MKIIVIAQTEGGEELGRSEITVIPDGKVIVSSLELNAAAKMLFAAAREVSNQDSEPKEDA